MKFFGHANLQQNELQAAVLPLDTYFPNSPVVGQLAFVNRIVYICVSTADGLPVWCPMTRELTEYVHNQNTTSANWVITHNLNTTAVQVQVFDPDNKMVIPDNIQIVNANAVYVDFNTPVNGRAVILSGHTDGNVKPTYSYTHYQSSASTTWVIVHGLGYNPIIRVFIGNDEVQPLSIVHDSTNQVTITFSTAQAGYAKLI